MGLIYKLSLLTKSGQTMNNTQRKTKIALYWRIWHIRMIHSKVMSSFHLSKYEEGATWLLEC